MNYSNFSTGKILRPVRPPQSASILDAGAVGDVAVSDDEAHTVENVANQHIPLF